MRFTQFNAVPTSINPAFAGIADEARLVSIYRNQWAALPQAFTGYHVAHDWYNRDLRSGYGILFSQEQAGSGALRNTRIAVQYAYEVPLGNGWRFRPALQLGAGSRAIDISALTFTDQLIREDDNASVEAPAGAARNYFDLGAGGVVVGQQAWVGFSADHLNTPDESLNDSYIDPLGIRLSAHGGYRFALGHHPRAKRESDLILAFNYTAQDQFDQLDMGVYYDAKPFQFGIWYRGIPHAVNPDGSRDIDGVSAILGYGVDDWNVGYSYDITLSQLGLGTTGGSHEIVLRYTWKTDRRNRPTMNRHIPCPSF
jgi:type IX secretion system PorP/SprF family membrane protein